MTTFTVAIPTHDRRETVVAAVRSLLRQTRAPEQIVVTCDGCTDGTADALRALGEHRIEVVELPKGRGYAYGHRNVALERATGEVILWLADDDLLLPEHVERLEARWDEGDVDIVTTPAAIVHPDDRLEWIGRDWGVPFFRDWVRERNTNNTNVMASVAVRTALLRDVGGWDDAIDRAADWDLWRRALDAGARAVMLDDPTVLHFRATGRDQAWSLRVLQNERWLARIADADALPALRRELRRTRGVADGELLRGRLEEVAAVQAHAERVEAGAVAARDHAVALEAHRDELERDAAALRAHVAAQDEAAAALRGRIAVLEAERRADAERLAAVEADRDRLRTVLHATYSGGWWRVRGVLRAVLGTPARVARRSRRRDR